MGAFGTSTNGFFAAFGFAFRHRLWWLFFVPFLFWFALIALMFWVDQAVVGYLDDRLSAYLHVAPGAVADGWEGVWNSVKAFFEASRTVIIRIVLHVALWYLFLLIGKYVVLAVLSPVLAYASERTEEVLTGRSFPFRLGPFLREVLRGLLMTVRNGLLELLLNIAVWAATLFVPVLTPLSAIVLFGISCWFYGFSMFDYIHERHRLGIGASVSRARSNFWLVLGNGFWSNILMKIPVLGVTFVPLMASIGAVIAAHEAGKGYLEGEERLVKG